jgi:inner membrane protein
MDILTHTLSGVAVAGAVAALTAKPLWKKTLVLCCGAMGAVLPDIDTITLWSRFDSVIGQRLGLPQAGHTIYFSNYWYSHHNWTHSLAAGAFFTLLIGLLIYLWARFVSKTPSFSTLRKTKGCYLLAFFLGYGMHLLGDLPTPGHTWHGIKLFWPLLTPIGGTAHLWWWNNYDIFILFAACCAAIAGLLVLFQIFKKPFLTYLPLVICLLTIGLALYQIAHRPVRFNHANHAANEKQSLIIQKKILGDSLYRAMVALDQQLKIHF